MSRPGHAKRKLKPTMIPWRFYAVIVTVCLMFAMLLARAAYIQIVEPDRLKREGDMRSLRTKTGDVQRGIITDRHGEELAVSVPVKAVWVDPKVIADMGGIQKRQRWSALADALSLDADKLISKIESAPNRRFMYIKRQVTPGLTDYVKKLKLPGVFLKNESRRFYPAGEVSAHIVGVTNIDADGIEGIEATYNDWLNGSPEKRRIRKDRTGRTVEELGVIEAREQPGDIELAIDQRIQALAYRELKIATEYHGATSGSVVVIDVESGEILALVNTPSFNPNNRRDRDPFRMRNRAVTDAFEPGSTVKPMVVLGALANGVVEQDSVIATSPGWMRIGGREVRDSKNYGDMTVRAVLQKSSNIGVTKMALQTSPDELIETFFQLGFGSLSDALLPGESSGHLSIRRKWSDFELATLSFGYGMTITPIQLARAYAVIGAGGIKYPLSILKLNEPPTGERVIEKHHVAAVLEMLESVTEEGGTGTKARVPGYRVAGKTGTARKAIAGGYGEEYVADFAGVAPLSQPKLAIAVVINEPAGDKYYGGDVAAPVFSAVMAGALHYLNIPPDAETSDYAGIWP
ncbi:peptidoglycan glycosyltransferase FtsI [Neiella marina]|uniref:Peptidoglycan D,D-transpeptidase FtsI n=1 Tax=Neiella holothuriorum TaxID=2870530 RepID=A0ABS7EB20_9GAMM|nr:penicillin-binding transpeptidase domain-containing protein [Neiella holothuriorum]MBW8189529.1 peptidoglycan glycosyltransferase FtsI [Neiella holothuriorum]